MTIKGSGLYISANMKMAELLMQNHYCVLMAEHFGIQLPVQERTIDEVCAANSINVEVFLQFANLLSGIDYTPSDEYSFDDIMTIISYLHRSHQYYLEERCPLIREVTEKVCSLNNYAEVSLLKKFVNEYIAEISEHLAYETKIVFPYIRELRQRLMGVDSERTTTNYSVVEYKEQHHDIAEKLADMRNLLIKYLPVKDDGRARRELLFALKEFEVELSIHSQMEDSILIPLVEKMENKLNEADVK